MNPKHTIVFLVERSRPIVSERPAVLGNMPEPDDADRFERVAFLGQVPVKVRGTVEAGDYLIPSGYGDGSAVAVSANEIALHDIDRVIGKAGNQVRLRDLSGS